MIFIVQQRTLTSAPRLKPAILIQFIEVCSYHMNTRRLYLGGGLFLPHEHEEVVSGGLFLPHEHEEVLSGGLFLPHEHEEVVSGGLHEEVVSGPFSL